MVSESRIFIYPVFCSAKTKSSGRRAPGQDRGASPCLRRRGEQLPAAWKTFEFVKSAVAELEAGAGHEVGHDPRDQHFVRLRLRHDARGGVHGDAADIPAPDLDFAGMQSGAQRQADLLGGRPERQRAADRASRPIDVARTPSPVDLIRDPRCFSTICLANWSWLSSKRRHVLSPASAAVRVESTISVNSNVAKTRSSSVAAPSRAPVTNSSMSPSIASTSPYQKA